MNKGIFYNSIKTFMLGFFGILGLSFGIFFFFALFGALASTTNPEIERHYGISVLPNSKGVRKVESSSAPVVLQLNIAGLIGGELLNTQTIRQQLQESQEGVLKNNRVKALLLNINSPGGTVVDSDNIYRLIMAYKKEHGVPVYAHIDGLCASGGMYIASAADKVYATDVSLVGSVGVLSPSFFNFVKLMEKVGVEALTLTEGKGKDDMNPLRPWKEGESDSFQKIIKYYYTSFVDIVTNARPRLSKDKLVNEYGALVFPSELAQQYGYIDGNNISRSETLELLVKEIGIDDDYYQVVQMKDDNWVNKLVTGQAPAWMQGTVRHKIEFPFGWDPAFDGKFLYLYSPQGER